jgi:heme/copper-type cytochrome/quinol oxidase subunit 3
MSDIVAEGRPLPIGSVGAHGSGLFGVWCLVATEGALFAYLLFSYFYCAMQGNQHWPPGGNPSLTLALINTAVLLLSSLAVWLGLRGVRRGSQVQLIAGLSAGIVLGILFVAIQLIEWSHKPFSISSSLYGSLFFTITGFHMAHVIVGLLMLSAMLIRSLLGYFDRERHGPIAVGAIYWHFVDGVWLAVLASLYLSPYLGGRP